MHRRLLFQKMPMSAGLSAQLRFYRSRCPDPSPDPPSQQNTSMGQSDSNCLLRDMEAPKRLVHLLCSGVGQKEEEQQEEKLL